MNIQFTKTHLTAGSEFDADILIFKTGIQFKRDLKKVEPVLNSNPRIIQWTIDREDVDHVLRIESTNLTSEEIINLITKAGFCCEELSD